MYRGYVKIWRKTADWEWSNKLDMIGFLVMLVIKANHKDQNYQGVIIPRGSFVSSIKKISDLCKISERTTRTYLKRLFSTGELTQKTTQDFSVYTLVNYEEHQDESSSATRETTREVTSKRHAKRQASDTRSDTHNKNVKNVKECKKENTHFEIFWKAYPKKKDKAVALKVWNRIKPDEELVQTILRAIAEQSGERAKLESMRKFTPDWKYPATWLNAESWKDEVSPPPKVKAGRYESAHKRATRPLGHDNFQETCPLPESIKTAMEAVFAKHAPKQNEVAGD